MSIRTNPMKAIPVLLKRVKMARRKFKERGRDESFDGKLEKLRRELNKIEDVFMRVKNNQDALLDTLHDIDSHLRNLDRTWFDQDMDGLCRRIRDCAHKLVPMDSFESGSSDDPSSPQQYNNQLLLPQPPHLNLQHMHPFLRDCLVSLLIFPANAVIKKRQAIYFWIGEKYIDDTKEYTAEEEGEYMIIDELLKLEVIVAYGNDKYPIINKFKLNPHIRHQLESFVQRENAEGRGYYLTIPDHQTNLVLAQQRVTLGHEVKSFHGVYNISANYLNFVTRWLDKGRTVRLYVLHLGRWQDSPSHHIEVGSQEFLNNLSNQDELRYLSLRGISRIFELPPSIAQIKQLKILDLKACHNLETLPDDISSMTSLTHLILSQCYLLDGMPKGIDKLTQLQVLKGFLLGSSGQTPCRISDLAKLSKLRRLSIRIKSAAMINDREFESLGELSALEHLKISWGVYETRLSDIQIIFPSRLKKLHLECFPGQKIPELKPSKPFEMPSISLEELKLTGGNLQSMNHDKEVLRWSIEIVRLKYLRHLEVDINTLHKLFPLLRYAEIRKISNHSYFEWWD